MKIEDYFTVATASRARSTNVATIVTGTVHGFQTGNIITISGLGGTGYNQTDVSITVTNTTTFTYANSGGDEGTQADTGGTVFESFNFPYNPNVYDDAIDPFIDQRDYAYNFSYFGMTDPIKSKRAITITGHTSGTTKNTDFRALVRHVNINKLKRLYFGTDKFIIVIPKAIKRTQAGGRTNFIDYVASFVSPFGLLFYSTQSSGAYNSVTANGGNVTTPIEKITGTVSAASQVTIKDKNGDGFIFTPTGSGTMTMYIIKMVALGSGIYITDYIYVDVGGTKQVIKTATSGQDMLLKLDAGESLTTRFNSGSAALTNITGVTFYFRDGYSSD